MAFDDYDDPMCSHPEPICKPREEYQCPECGSFHTYNVTFPNFVHSRFGDYVRGCRSCGHKWDEMDRCTG